MRHRWITLSRLDGTDEEHTEALDLREFLMANVYNGWTMGTLIYSIDSGIIGIN